MKENLIIIHGGGPTAVLNCSLYGAVREAQASGLVEHVYGAVGGTGGLLKEKLLDFGSVPEEELERLPTTPATAIGTSRDALEAEDYARMADILAEKHIRYVLMNGGNGTMDACGKLAAVCRDRGISVMGIPKTMDNDIAVTDHCPGFGSVARYMAGTVRELGVDVRSLPIHVVVLEALGRNAGWTTAAAALAREFSVSRQIIVGDVALLRAGGLSIAATPRGYMLPEEHSGLVRTLACRHRADQMEDELNAIVDQGCTVIDVIVEHPIYGQLTGPLQLSSRYDVIQFVDRCRQSDALPLSNLTEGIHLHTISCPDETAFQRVQTALEQLGVLLEA